MFFCPLQGMGMIAATFLLIMEEEDAFWMMCAVRRHSLKYSSINHSIKVIEDLLPPSYFSPSLVGIQADQVS